MFKHVLVPLDGSRFGSRAVRYANDVAKHFNAEVTLLQVVTTITPAPTVTGMVPPMESSVSIEIAVETALEEEKRHIAHARRYLSNKARVMRSQDIKVSYQVVVGNPARSIMEFAKKEHIDLIIMTTHGKSGLNRAIMGSVADAVIRESGKPVLVIRPQMSSNK